MPKLKTEYRAMMFIKGAEVPSSCIRAGTWRECRNAAKILNNQEHKHPDVSWVVLPAIKGV